MTRQIKVLHVVHSMGIGGLENGVVNLLTGFNEDGFAHTVCCLTSSGKMAEQLRDKGIEILEWGLPTNKFRLPLIKLARVFRRLQPDIVHTRGWGAVDAVFAARLARVPRIIHGEHGREWTDTSGTHWRRNQIRRLIGLVVDRYVVVCGFFRPWLRETCKVADRKIVHIPNGVDTLKFHPLGEEQRAKGMEQSADGRVAVCALRDNFGLPAEAFLIGSVGRLDPVKDFPTLMKGFAAVQADFPEAHLVIVGDGPARSQLTALARDLGVSSRVQWMGEREDVPELLRCFDLFVQTSLFEGMSNTILEAMATGLPVITTDAGGNSELVVEGINGRLITVGDVQGLAQSLQNYLRDGCLRQKHGRKSRERALAEFDLSLMVRRYRALYSEFKGFAGMGPAPL